MKRSEMLRRVKEVIDAGRDDYDLETRADNLLCYLEVAGMIPPKRWVNGEGIGEEPSDPAYHGLNGWEPE